MGFLKRLPIRSQLLIVAGSVIIVSLLLFFLTYLKTADIVKKNSNTYTGDLFLNIREAIDSNCDSLNRILTGTAYSSIIQDYLLAPGPLDQLNSSKNLNTFLTNMMGLKEGIIDIVVIGVNGSSYSINGGTEFCRQQVGKVPERVPPSYSKLLYANYANLSKYCFIISTNIYSIDKDRQLTSKIGTLHILVTPDAIISQKGLGSKKSREEIYLLDSDFKVFSVNKEMEPGKRFDLLDTSLLKNPNAYRIKLGKEAYSAKTDKLPAINGYIVSLAPEKELLADIVDLRQIQLLIYGLAMVFLAIPFIIVTNNITQPLQKIMTFMKSIQSGNLKNLDKRIDLQGYSEMSVMAGEFNSMMDEIHDLTHRLVDTSTMLYESELEKKKFELAMLKSQINPHFLYNTLESIKGYAVKEGIAEIRDMAKSLGKMFQYSIKGDDFVYLKDELGVVKSYIQIQQIRFKDRFDIEIDLAEDLEECYVNKMILQPIVENAIYHGLEPKKGKGRLWIGGAIRQGNKLLLRIRDDGLGIEPDVLDRIKESLQTGDNRLAGVPEKNGIGIANVNSRIKFIYGSNYGCDIESVRGEYTEVTVRLPVRREKDG